MDRETELQIVRRAYARHILWSFNVVNPAVEAAYAAVPRERYLGPGPWQILRIPGGYVTTPDDDPVFVYADNLVGPYPARYINNGQPSLHAALIANTGLRAGERVVHVGAGTGYYTVRIAECVGPSGRVFATDIQPQMLTLLRERLARARLQNVEVVQATETDPRLPKGRLDLVLMVDTYHELARPQEVLRRLRAALVPDGALVLIEFRKESAWVPIREEHKMSVREARLELEAEGYRFERVLDVLPWQHILVFRR